MPDSASLEIHHINVSQGDSVLIVIRDLDEVEKLLPPGSVPDDPIDYVPEAIRLKRDMSGTVKKALLIDAGDTQFGGDVVGYLKQHGVVAGFGYQPLLEVLISHPHQDHMAGIRSIFKQRVDPAKGRKVTYVDYMRPAVLYKELPHKDTDPTSKTWKLLVEDIDKATTAKPGTKLVHVLKGGRADSRNPTKINLGKINGISVDLTLIASGQGVHNAQTGTIKEIATVGAQTSTSTKGKKRKKGGKTKVDQNDRSIVGVLQYGSFRYFLGGDIAGNGGAAGGNFLDCAVDTSKKKSYSQHANVETDLGEALEASFPKTKLVPDTVTPTDPKAPKAPKRLIYPPGEPIFLHNGYATVMKANHHASSSSCDIHLFGTLRPLLFIVNSGVKSRPHGHPTKETINRATASHTAKWQLRDGTTMVDNTVAQVYVTECAETYHGGEFDTDLYDGKIIGDIVVRPVDGTVTACQDAIESGTKLRVQVYGTGKQTARFSNRNALRDLDARDVNASGSTYPMGPWEHEDTH
ncbi:hypothetical protein [Yinghuangia seranimata]|uniref:hypothetical protein n=1 Tax=Yinghuangia seranimata TaxID=408067 RepID=UPI00248D106C|nr:hypothetical protein [Yinghuangia seranimata]MDI2124826.1 hypothetical protein [Yinghuangia seranimata]